jgi:hypothetical protein
VSGQMLSKILVAALAMVIILFCIIFGSICIYGAYQRWPKLIDPPIDGKHFNSQALLKCLFGKKFLLYYTYFMGISFVIAGTIGLWNVLKELLS